MQRYISFDEFIYIVTCVDRSKEFEKDIADILNVL